jgi:type IV pilus assembly protein PilO
MALIPNDKRGQLMVAFTVFAGIMLYFLYGGVPLVGVPGFSQLAKTRDSVQRQIDSLTTQVTTAKRVVRQGAVAQLERRLAEYRASLDLMRQLVPGGEEIPNLLDDISSRAKVRGANIANFQPAALESGSPFDVKRVRFSVTGQYDQIGEFLADIASLPRIIVPYDVRLQRAAVTPGDTSRGRGGAQLQATFQIVTYVKPLPGDTTRMRRAPARPGAPAAPRRAG